MRVLWVNHLSGDYKWCLVLSNPCTISYSPIHVQYHTSNLSQAQNTYTFYCQIGVHKSETRVLCRLRPTGEKMMKLQKFMWNLNICFHFRIRVHVQFATGLFVHVHYHRVGLEIVIVRLYIYIRDPQCFTEYLVKKQRFNA